MYAERKTIPLEDVRIRLSHYRRDPAHSSSGEMVSERIDAIDGAIQLVGDVNTDPRQRLLEIAGRCRMHRALSSGVDINFDLKGDVDYNFDLLEPPCPGQALLCCACPISDMVIDV